MPNDPMIGLSDEELDAVAGGSDDDETYDSMNPEDNEDYYNEPG